MLGVSNFFATSNYIEAGVWVLIAAVVAVRARGWKYVWLTAATLVVFGASDVVEASTGAWWDPWWLLVWKGVCVFVLLGVVIAAVRGRKRGKAMDDGKA